MIFVYFVESVIRRRNRVTNIITKTTGWKFNMVVGHYGTYETVMGFYSHLYWHCRKLFCRCIEHITHMHRIYKWLIKLMLNDAQLTIVHGRNVKRSISLEICERDLDRGPTISRFNYPADEVWAEIISTKLSYTEKEPITCTLVVHIFRWHNEFPSVIKNRVVWFVKRFSDNYKSKLQRKHDPQDACHVHITLTS